MTGGIGEISALAQATDGRIVVATEDGVYSLMGNKFVRVVPGEAIAIALSEQGRLVFSRDDPSDSDRIHLFAATLPSKVRGVIPVRRLPTSRASFPAFSPDGKMLAYGILFSGISYGIGISKADGTSERIIIRRPGRIAPIRWSPDGRSLYYGVRVTEGGKIGEIRVERLRLEEGAPETVVQMPFASRSISTNPAWPGLSPDGKVIAVQTPMSANGPMMLEVLNAEGKHIRAIELPHIYGAVVWAEDSRSVLVGTDGKVERITVN